LETVEQLRSNIKSEKAKVIDLPIRRFRATSELNSN
jgi:hypothetical protein